MLCGDIIIHGGSYFGEMFKDTWKAKIDSVKNEIHWERLEDSAEGRWQHCSETIGSLCIFIGGEGVECMSTLVLNLSTKEWLRADPIKLQGHKSWVYNQEI